MIEVTKVTVMVNGPGTDTVFVQTEHPSPLPHVTEEPLTVTFEVESGRGISYALTHFPGKPVYTIDMKTGKKEQLR